MFKIYGGHEKFTQWSKDQKLTMNRLPLGAEVLFYNDPTVDEPLITEVYAIVDAAGNTVHVCDVPNILLTEAKRIKVKIPAVVVGLFGNAHKYVGQREKYFEVEPAEKPSDYVYEETETEGSGSVSDEKIQAAVDKYLEENGVSGGVSDSNIATDEEVEEVLNKIYGTY